MGLETHVNWPNASGKYKVVQFIADNKPYIRFNAHGEKHNAVVHNFAAEAGIEPVKKEKNGALLCLLPQEKGMVTGAGYCQFDLEKKTAEFFGRSSDYFEAGIYGIDEKHLDLIRKLYQDINIKYNPGKLL